MQKRKVFITNRTQDTKKIKLSKKIIQSWLCSQREGHRLILKDDIISAVPADSPAKQDD